MQGGADGEGPGTTHAAHRREGAQASVERREWALRGETGNLVELLGANLVAIGRSRGAC